MRFDKFTIKSQELIQNSQALASQYNHQQIEPEHLLAAMLGNRKELPVPCSVNWAFRRMKSREVVAARKTTQSQWWRYS